MNQYQNSRNSRRPTYCPMPCSVSYPTPSKTCNSQTFAPVDSMPLAMAYVPFQKFTTTFDTCVSLRMGTIFPDLCKPFCGKRGCVR